MQRVGKGQHWGRRVVCLEKSWDSTGPDGSSDSTCTSASINGDADPVVKATLMGKALQERDLCRC